jgi:hypothetical protein
MGYIANGDKCSFSTECYSNICTAGMCTAPTDCATNLLKLGCPAAPCNTNPKQPGCPGTVCKADTQCLSGMCSGGTCTKLDCSGTPVDPGCPCTDSTQCMDADGSCGNGTCSVGGQASFTCKNDGQCEPGTACQYLGLNCKPGQKDCECANVKPGEDGALCPDGKCSPGYTCVIEPGTSDGHCRDSACNAVPASGLCPANQVILEGLSPNPQCCPLSVFGDKQLSLVANTCHISDGKGCDSSMVTASLGADAVYCCKAGWEANIGTVR